MTTTSDVRLDAAPNAWTAAALNAVPQGAHLSFAIRPQGDAEIFLLHIDDITSLPATDLALYHVRSREETRFSVVVPKGGDYALVLSNPSDVRPLRASVTIGATGPNGLDPDGFEEAANQMLTALSTAMGRLFRFGDPGFRAERIGQVIPFQPGDDGAIRVSTEYAMILLARAPADAVSPIMMLSMFTYLADRVAQPAGRSLNTSERDRLALALMSMLGYRDQAMMALNALNDAEVNAAILDELDEGHASVMDAPRARAARILYEGNDLIAEWKDVLLAAIGDETLAQMAEAPPRWTSRDEVEAEIAGRL